ncbi:hypothetical protein LTR37_018601 [Vermiconidia calcicola]|uniref:Uncharacterized protein n=1 Tax=Vermiconidia calcicola TaxID=1690605 RepID=A0ACC3MGM3_9PEZI|nr:hypothetical protein LTR37_018601 [Vermiconidia calcicola]
MSKALQEAFAQYDEGKIDRDALVAEQDKAAKDSVQRTEETGETLVTDGEQRISSFATYPLIHSLGPPSRGGGLADNLKPDGQYFAIFDDGHHRQLPRLTSGPFKYRNWSADYFSRSKPYASKCGMKTAVIAPSMLYLLYPLQGDVPGYPKEQFVDDLVNECEKDIRKCFDAGAQRVSIDFTEGRLAVRNDPSNPWTGAQLLKTFVDINNKVLDRFSAEERTNIGIHTCPGGDCDSTHSADVDYHELLPQMFQMNAGYFLIQCASEKDKREVYKEIGECIRKDANVVKQVAFVGFVNPQAREVESAESICEQILEAAKYIPTDQPGATDDCGFSPFSIDVKPKHGSPDFARDIAFQKIANRVKAAGMAREKLSK